MLKISLKIDEKLRNCDFFLSPKGNEQKTQSQFRASSLRISLAIFHETWITADAVTDACLKIGRCETNEKNASDEMWWRHRAICVVSLAARASPLLVSDRRYELESLNVRITDVVFARCFVALVLTFHSIEFLRFARLLRLRFTRCLLFWRHRSDVSWCSHEPKQTLRSYVEEPRLLQQMLREASLKLD